MSILAATSIEVRMLIVKANEKGDTRAETRE